MVPQNAAYLLRCRLLGCHATLPQMNVVQFGCGPPFLWIALRGMLNNRTRLDTSVVTGNGLTNDFRNHL